MQHPPSVYDLLAAQVPVAVQSLVLALAIVLLLSYYVRRDIARSDDIIPDGRVTLRNFVELLLEGIANLGRDVMGEQWMKYMPLVGTLGAFILISNLMGLIPGIGGATSFVETAFSWALISFGIYNYVGIRAHGWKYIYQFMGPSLWEPEIGGKVWHVRVLSPLFLPLELLLHVARVVTLTVRLVANMYADHTVVGVWITLVPIAVPAVFMALGTLVAFLQAFVFSLLTMIYIGSALEEAH